MSPLTWAVLAGRGALIGRRHWQLLTPKKRRRLRELIAKSRGRPSNLTADERAEVQKLVSKLELRRLGVDLAALASPVPIPGRNGKPGRTARRNRDG
jgi:hypothetical protein